MTFTTKFKAIAASTLLSAMLVPVTANAQSYAYRRHQHYKHVQERSDARHHTKAKIVGGSAVGGAVIGGLLGGPKGAVIGAGVGAGGGLLANHARKEHDIHQRERGERY